MVTMKRRDKRVTLFYALSHETRLEIMQRLKDGEQSEYDLTDALKTGPWRLSFHLKVLKDAGLITDRPDDRGMYYGFHPDAMEELEEMVHWLTPSRPGVGFSSQY